jgi:hypothetical protein
MESTAGTSGIDPILEEIAGVTEAAGRVRHDVEAMVAFLSEILPDVANVDVRKYVKQLRLERFDNVAALQAIEVSGIVRRRCS